MCYNCFTVTLDILELQLEYQKCHNWQWKTGLSHIEFDDNIYNEERSKYVFFVLFILGYSLWWILSVLFCQLHFFPFFIDCGYGYLYNECTVKRFICTWIK